MKTTLTFFLFLTFFKVYSQDTIKIRQIDALVSQINNATLPIQRDTLVQDHPEWGLKMTTYLSMIVTGGELLKYVNLVNVSRLENGVTRQMTTSSSIYYDHNKLIKVEEYAIESAGKQNFDWYYSDDKPLYHTLKSGYTLKPDKGEDRATLLLKMSKEMLKQIIK